MDISSIKICFLILRFCEQYEIIDKALSSILSLDGGANSRIVLVDNNSNDDVIDRLLSKYSGNDWIDTIVLDNNYGFSKANNYGFAYIKDNYNPDFIICVNPDVFFVQRDFLVELVKLHSETDFWIAGPDIYVPDLFYHANPMESYINDEHDVLKRINVYKKRKKEFMKQISLTGLKAYEKEKHKTTCIMRTYMWIKNRLLKKSKNRYIYMKINTCLQGACLIFDKRFILNNNKLFSPETFLYHEEDILYFRCRNQNMRTVYSPRIYVEHMGQASSRFSEWRYRELCEKKAKQMEEMEKSIRIYYEYMVKSRCLETLQETSK